jgi:hypothetical protein
MTKASQWSYGRLVLGCGTFGGIGATPQLVGRGMDERAAFETMDEAVELGITLFDTAEAYGGGASEIMIGRWLAERASEATSRILLATKVAPGYLSGDTGTRLDAAFLETRLSSSLRRLGVGSVELLYTYRPDDATPIEDTLEGLEAIRASAAAVSWAPATSTQSSSQQPSMLPNDWVSRATRSYRTATACCSRNRSGPYAPCAPTATSRSPRIRHWPVVRLRVSIGVTAGYRQIPVWRCGPMGPKSCSPRQCTTLSIASATRPMAEESIAVPWPLHGCCTSVR